MAKKTTATQPFLPAALQVASGRMVYRFLLSASLFVLMLCLLALHYSEVGFFILVLLNTLFCADVFVACAWADLKRGRIGFALLVSVAVYAGFFYSACHTLLLQPVFGPVSEIYLYVSFFLTLALWVQSRRIQRCECANAYIKKIDDFLPKSGRKYTNGTSQMIFASELHPQDTVLVKPGERFPCDGQLVRGKTAVDEQLITGNCVAAYKQPGSTVYAATVNKSSEVLVEISHPLEQSAIMQIVHALQAGERRRNEFVTELDTYAAWGFVGLIVVSALRYAWQLHTQGTAMWFHDLGLVLILLSLGAPVALLFVEIFPVFFARRYAARRQMCVQNHHVLYLLSRADWFVFDKTGTLTQGQLTVDKISSAVAGKEKELLKALACAEDQVDSPFAKAIKAYARQQGLAPVPNDSLEVLPGMGVQVTQGKHVILAGRPGWIAEQGIDLPASMSDDTQTLVCVAKDGVYLGYVTFADELRPGASELIRFLKSKKKKLLLVSGDNGPAVAEVAKQIGLENQRAEVLPEQKACQVRQQRQQGKRVIMVGDGFNDIVALLEADGGVAYALRKNIYTNWVDILIFRPDLLALIDLFKLSRKVRQCVRENAWLSFVLSIGWVEILFARAPQPSDWRFALGGSLGIVLLVFLNSMRLLKIK